MSSMEQPEIDELVTAWQEYCSGIVDWQELVQGATPTPTGCGPVYELANPLGRDGEDFAIADMRHIKFAEPHYHPAGNWEFYIVLQGTATVVVGGDARQVRKGDAVTIPPDTAHFTIPDQNFVIAAINTPPFKPENYIILTASKPDVKYDHEQFEQLIEGAHR